MLDSIQQIERPEELARRCQEDDTRAFAELLDLFGPRVHGFLCKMVGNTHDAEDLTQEVFVKAYRNIRKFDPSRPFPPWLFTIARRTALNHFRSRKTWVELPEEMIGSGEDGPEREADLHERVDNLWAKARRVLTGREFEALWLRFGEELSTAETAAATGQSVPGIKTLIFRARQRLLSAKESFL